jgi:hypothetical protein
VLIGGDGVERLEPRQLHLKPGPAGHDEVQLPALDPAAESGTVHLFVVGQNLVRPKRLAQAPEKLQEA